MNNNALDFTHLLEKYGNHPALMWPNGQLNYLEYFQYIYNISNQLKKQGFRSGDKVAVLSDIHHQFPILFFAILLSGGLVVPINPKLPVKKIHTLLKEINCDLVVTINSKLIPIPDNNIKVLSANIFFDIPLEYEKSEMVSSLKFENEATIIFTSGTRGNPRGVLHTIGNHYYSAAGSNQNIRLNHNDCWIVALPFYHIAGIAILFRTLIAGATCFVLESTQDFSYYLKNHHITHLSLVATQLHRWLLKNDLAEYSKSIKAILLGGGQISQTLIEKALQRKLPIFTSYGSTEMSSQITTTSDQDLIKNPASSGKVLPYRELIINKKDEILVKGKTLCRGYISGNEIIDCSDKSGWFHTGDLGYYDKNDNLIILGRRDNMFVSGGENIYPEEVEQHLQGQNNIARVCVVDIPDVEYGARPVAFIKMDGTNQIDEFQLKKYLKDKIAGIKIPLRFFPWPENFDQLKPDRKYFRKEAIAKLIKE